MISDALILLKDTLNDYLSSNSGWNASDTELGQVVFIESEKIDSIDLKMGTISLVLVNIEEEHSVRAGDPRRRTLSDGTTMRVQPSIHLNLYVLFVARFKDYKQSLRYLSHILQFFLGHRVLDHENAPAMSDKIEKLTMELLSLPLAEQNNLWSVLRTAYQPSLFYKVRMVVFHDEDGVVIPPGSESTVRINE